jgi:hypothetical protein
MAGSITTTHDIVIITNNQGEKLNITKITFDKLPDESQVHFNGRVKRSIANMRKNNCHVTRLNTTCQQVIIEAPMAAISYITPKIID